MVVEVLVMLLFNNFVAVSANNGSTFKPMMSVYGSQICAIDSPSTVIRAFDVLPNTPYEAAEAIKCAWSCTNYGGCVGFNVRPLATGSAGGRQCELFTIIPEHCTTTVVDCQYYQVGHYMNNE
jgi:hypothetical protein